MVTIRPGGCSRCQGTLKEDLDNKEWSCMNCGRTYPILTEVEVKEQAKEPAKEGYSQKKTSIQTKLDILNTEITELEDQENDLEWNNLVGSKHL